MLLALSVVLMMLAARWPFPEAWLVGVLVWLLDCSRRHLAAIAIACQDAREEQS